jgi:very-short-patch-repair endonuclease
VHRPTTLPAEDVGLFDGTIPITSPARTILDLAATATFGDTERATQQALVQKLVTPAELRERIRGQRGSIAVKAILAAPRGRTESDGEDRLWALIVKAGLRRPERNAWIHGHKVDFLWRDERLVVEADSVAYHSLRANVEKDRRRDATLRAHGHQVLRFTWTQITHEPEVVIAGIAAALATATAARRP